LHTTPDFVASWEFVEPQKGAALVKELALLAGALHDLALKASGSGSVSGSGGGNGNGDQAYDKQTVVDTLKMHAQTLAGVVGTVTGRMLINTGTAIEGAAAATAEMAAEMNMQLHASSAVGYPTAAAASAAIVAAIDLVGTARPAEIIEGTAEAALERHAARLEAHIAPSPVAARSHPCLARLERAAAAAALHATGALHLVIDGDGVSAAVTCAPPLGTPWLGYPRPSYQNQAAA
jgi:hypothetical protein